MRLVKQVFLILALCFMALVIMDHWSQLSVMDINIKPDRLLISTGFITILFFLDALAWHFILRTMDAHINPVHSIRVWILSSLTKYIPGGIWPYASRVAMAREYHVNPSISVMSLYLETILLALSALTVGSPSITSYWNIPLNTWQSLFISSCSILLLHPSILRFWSLLPGKMGRFFSQLNYPTFRSILQVYCYYVIYWVLFGAAFAYFVSALIDITMPQAILLGESMAISFFIGFILIIFPGGIGVRESTMYLLLVNVIGSAPALVAAVSSRLWIIAGEVVSLLIVLIAEKNKK